MRHPYDGQGKPSSSDHNNRQPTNPKGKKDDTNMQCIIHIFVGQCPGACVRDGITEREDKTLDWCVNNIVAITNNETYRREEGLPNYSIVGE